MGSSGLSDLLLGIREVRALRGYPPRTPLRVALHVTKDEAQIAHRRACVVLLSSHYERYIYALNESAVDFLNGAQIMAADVPVDLRLLQIRSAVDRLAETQWTNRQSHLVDFFSQFSTHWQPSTVITGLKPASNLEWMKSPQIANVKRFFTYFGVNDIVRTITRSEGTRRTMERQLQGLVDARNGIAHGDQTIQPDATEISNYLVAVEGFCVRSDKVMSRRLGSLAKARPPW